MGHITLMQLPSIPTWGLRGVSNMGNITFRFAVWQVSAYGYSALETATSLTSFFLLVIFSTFLLLSISIFPSLPSNV